MRLIDADALLEAMRKEDVLKVYECIQLVNNAPTIQREGWLPIKSAPKGEAVLVAGGDCNYPCVANYSGHPEECWCVDGQMDTYAEIGWPTHWIPLDSLPALPAAPTETE